MDKKEVLILSVGGTEEPLIFSINTFKPDIVVFIHSSTTLYNCAKVISKVQWQKENKINKHIFNLFEEYENDFFKIFKEFIPNFSSPTYNKEFYSKFIDFLDENYFKNLEEFKYKFLDFIYNLEIDENYYSEFSEIINNDTKVSEKFYSKIKSEKDEFKKDMLTYLENNISPIIDNSDFENDIILRAEIKDHESLDNSFDVSKKVFNKFKNVDEYNVKVDFTGGTKTMVSGIVLAVVEGAFKNFEFRYVGSEHSKKRTKNGLGVVEDGSEITKIQINPYEKYGILEINRGKNFFNRYQFKAATENFENANNILEEGPRKELSEYYYKLSTFYQTWDKFNRKILVENKKERKKEKKRLNTYLQKELIEKYPKHIMSDDLNNSDEFFNQLNDNLKFLRLKLANDVTKGIKYYLPDLLNNACRKIDEGYYDDAVARLYRAIELIAQIELTNLGIIDETRLISGRVFYINRKKFDEKTIDKPDIRDLIKDLTDDYNKEKPIFKLALYNSYLLLQKFGIEVGEYYIENELDTTKRNNSILAHGLEPLDKQSACDFYGQVLTFSKKTYPNIKKYMDLAKFPKFE